jgi:hypothetical protein
MHKKMSNFTKKNAASETIKKSGPAAAVKLQKQRMDVSKLTMRRSAHFSLLL